MAPARVLYDRDEVQSGVRRVAAEVSAAVTDEAVFVSVLKGSVPFLADLARALTIRPRFDFLALSAYAPDSGRVRIVKDLDLDVAGCDVVLVEDIVDTGLTLNFLRRELGRRDPRSVRVCTLLDKRVRRIVPVDVEHIAFEIADEFVVGYGLDFAGRYRNLASVWAGDLAALRADPDAHVEAMYRG